VAQSPPRAQLLINQPVPMPVNEEFQVRVSASGTDTASCFIILATPDWNQNHPRGLGPLPYFVARCSATITGAPYAWSALSALTFEQGLRGGTYAVAGAQLQGTNVLAFRLVFPHMPNYKGRFLRPGYLASQAVGDQMYDPNGMGPGYFGIAGKFATFEPLQIEIWASSSSSIACAVLLWLIRVSEDQNAAYP